MSKKTIELSAQQKIENATIYALMTWFFCWQSIVWYCRGSMIRWQKRGEFLSFPVALTVFGDDPLACLDVLKTYGVYANGGSICWAVLWDKIGLRFILLVSKSQWELADNILFQTGCDAYLIASNPGSKRGQHLPRPFEQRTKTPRQHRSKLGKTYS